MVTVINEQDLVNYVVTLKELTFNKLSVGRNEKIRGYCYHVFWSRGLVISFGPYMILVVNEGMVFADMI